MEMAHRLFLTEGKCENIHGHSWQVKLSLWGEVNSQGLLEGIDFGSLKKIFRTYLDETFDHHVLLNSDDPLAGHVHIEDSGAWVKLPGLTTLLGEDPTTENIARTIGIEMIRQCLNTWPHVRRIKVNVWETKVNNSVWESGDV